MPLAYPWITALPPATTPLAGNTCVPVASPDGKETEYATVNDVTEHTLNALPGQAGFCETSTGVAETPIGIDIQSTGTVVVLTIIEDENGPNVWLNCGLYGLFGSINLIAGTDTVPVTNFVYAVLDEGIGSAVLELSTSGYPSTQHARIATVTCMSAATVLADRKKGLISVAEQHIYHYTENANGLLSALAESNTSRPPSYMKGGGAVATLHSEPLTDDYVTISLPPIELSRIRLVTTDDFPDPARMFAVNHPTSPYTSFTSFSNDGGGIAIDASGNAIGNNEYAQYVLWLISSNGAAEDNIMVNLPVAFDTVESQAVSNYTDYAVFDMPIEYRENAVMVARIVLHWKMASNGTWTIVAVDNSIVGVPPALCSRTGSSGQTVFPDSTFGVVSSSSGNNLDLNLDNLTSNQTLSIPDASGELASITIGTPSAGDPGVLGQLQLSPSGSNLFVYVSGWKKVALTTA
jgi:hypothetical protein